MSPECHISLSQIRQNNPPELSSDDDYCNITDHCKRTQKKVYKKNNVHSRKIHAVDFARLAVRLTCHQVEFIVWVFIKSSKLSATCFHLTQFICPGHWCDNPGAILMSRMTLSHITRHFRAGYEPHCPRCQWHPDQTLPNGHHWPPPGWSHVRVNRMGPE